MNARAVLVVLLTSVFALDPIYAVDDIRITFADGRVTVIAKEASLPAILERWSNLGETEFIDSEENGAVRAALERLSPQPIEIHLLEVSETKALEVLFRATKGFIAEPRSKPVSGLSRFNRVLILVASRTRSRKTIIPAFSGATSPLPAQRDPWIAIDPKASGATQDTDRGGAIEALRQILPQPRNQLRTSQPAEKETQPTSTPLTAPRPGIPVSSTTDESAPVFIR